MLLISLSARVLASHTHIDVPPPGTLSRTCVGAIKLLRLEHRNVHRDRRRHAVRRRNRKDGIPQVHGELILEDQKDISIGFPVNFTICVFPFNRTSMSRGEGDSM